MFVEIELFEIFKKMHKGVCSIGLNDKLKVQVWIKGVCNLKNRTYTLYQDANMIKSMKNLDKRVYVTENLNKGCMFSIEISLIAMDMFDAFCDLPA